MSNSVRYILTILDDDLAADEHAVKALAERIQREYTQVKVIHVYDLLGGMCIELPEENHEARALELGRIYTATLERERKVQIPERGMPQ